MRRIFGTGTDENIVRIELHNLLNGYPVTSIHVDVKIIVHKHLDEIVSKRVVIINDKQLGHTQLPKFRTPALCMYFRGVMKARS
jgi:hypothetical protein